MAITAHFSADFADFYSKVLTAETQLEGLTRTSQQVGTSLQRMVDSFSGTRLIEQATLTAEAIDRIGGTSKLSADELQKAATLAQQAVDKMELTGQQVPRMVSDLAAMKKETQELGSTASSVFPQIAGYLSGAAIATALLGAGKAALQFGDDVKKAADQTGMTYEQIQRLQWVSLQTGAAFGSMTRASQNLTEALGRGDSGVAGGIRDLGLNLDQLRTMDAYDRMVALADAIGKIEDPLKRAAAAREVFGKDWRELMPAIVAGFGDVAGAATKASDQAVEAAAKLKAAWEGTKRVLVITAAEIIGVLERIDQIKPPTLDFGSGIAGATAAAEQMAASLNQNLIPAVKQIKMDQDQWGVAMDSVIASATAAEGVLKANQKAAAEAAADYAKWQEAMVELNAAGDGWKGTLAGINGETIEAIKYYLDAGVSQSTLATAYGLTSVEVKAVVTSMREYNELLKEVAAVEKQRYSLNDIQAWSAGATAESRKVMEAELLRINTIADAEKQLAKMMQAATLADATDAQSAAQIKIDAVWREVAAKEKGFEAATAQNLQYRTAVETMALMEIEKINATASAAVEGMGRVARTAEETIDRVKAKTAEMSFNPNIVPSAESLTRAAYRPGSFLGVGSGQMVQSMITSAANMPWSLPAGVTIQSGAITMNYPLMNDPTAKDQIAGLVGDAVMSRLTRAGGHY